MKHLILKLLGVATVAVSLSFGMSAAQAQEVDLSGVWVSDDGDSHYSMDWCGDGTQLCAKLTWIKPEAQSKRNRKYIGTHIIENARLTRKKPVTWSGKLQVFGNEFSGQVVMVNQDRFIVKGCAYVFFCEETGANRQKS